MLWRNPRWAGLLMAAYVLLSLAVGPDVFSTTGPGPVGPQAHVFGALAAAFFAWRVTRGGRISRMLLIMATGIAFLVTAFVIASRFWPLVFGVLVAYGVQLALLLSPAVYQRTRPPGWPGRLRWTRVRPPAALLLFGALAGLVVTLLGLSHLNTPPAGCYSHGVPAAGIACVTFADGYPLRWLASYHSALVVSWGAMLKDLAQFTVISVSVHYGLWLGPRTREEPDRGRLPAAGIVVGSVLGGLILSAVTGGFPLTWVTAGQVAPTFTQLALLADTALWTFVALGGCLAVRVLMPLTGRRRPTGGAPHQNMPDPR
jgi:hypothetical protein